MTHPARLQFDAKRFVTDVRLAAAFRKVSMAHVARECRVNDAVLSRMKHHGQVPDVCIAVALASWAGVELADYVRTRAQ